MKSDEQIESAEQWIGKAQKEQSVNGTYFSLIRAAVHALLAIAHAIQETEG